MYMVHQSVGRALPSTSASVSPFSPKLSKSKRGCQARHVKVQAAKFGGKIATTDVNVGEQAVVTGLKNRTELNGATCRVVGTNKKTGELEVAFLAGIGKPVDKRYYQDKVCLRREFLQPVVKKESTASSTPEKALETKKDDSANPMTKIYEGTVSRLFGFSLDSGYEPGTAEAVKEGKCPRCGSVVTASMKPHKAGWCSDCQKSGALFDFSEGF